MKTSTPSDLLSLDLSTHTGWAFYKGGVLADVGYFDVKIENYVANIRKWTDIPSVYPYNLMTAAKFMSSKCITLWHQLGEPNIVTEHTEGSKHRISQRTLEFIHFALFSEFEEQMVIGQHSIKYLLNSDWRKHCKCYIKEWPEYQKWNKEVSKAKKKAKPTKSGARVAKIDGKIVSPIDQKKLSIIIAKKNHPDFADRIDNDNTADAVNLGDAAIALKVF